MSQQPQQTCEQPAVRHIVSEFDVSVPRCVRTGLTQPECSCRACHRELLDQVTAA